MDSSIASGDRSRANEGKILLVDDDQILRDRLARAFRERGFKVEVAGRVDEALRISSQEPPQMAVIDLRMPGASGLELVQSLRAIAPSVRIVVLTGYGSIATAVEAIRHGAASYLPKPADAEEILAALNAQTTTRVAAGSELTPSLARAEWEHIHRVLRDCDGNISQAARRLGIHRRSLQRKLQKRPPAV
ncbi:MAG TPA: response regulator [Myxococcaceae bacterium]|nr:response regulator [Myxococcaceae bacterium]